MSRFLADAQQILEAAEAATDPDLAIVIQGDAIRVLSGKGDWPLDSLLAATGAAAAYRVSRRGGQVIVEGQTGSETCQLRRRTPDCTIRQLLPEQPRYYVDNVAADPQWGSEARILLT